jgi:hypothetical protein
LSLCLKIHLSVTTLALGGRGTKSHVLLDSSASYSSIARRQWGSVSTLQTEVGTGDRVRGGAAAESCRQSTGLVTPAAHRVTIRWVLRGHEPWRRGGRPTTWRGGWMKTSGLRVVRAEHQGRLWRGWRRRGRACCELGCRSRMWRDVRLQSTCNIRGVEWSNRANRRTKREEGVQVVRWCAGGGKGKDDSSKMTCRENTSSSC